MLKAISIQNHIAAIVAGINGGRRLRLRTLERVA
jgi:hypothetical protein